MDDEKGVVESESDEASLNISQDTERQIKTV